MPASTALARDLILVTGMPRSGTTVVGDILGQAARTRPLYEPMNLHSGDRCIARYFERPGSAEFPFAVFDDLVRRIAELSLDLKPGVFEHEIGLRRLGKRLIGGQSRQTLRRARWAGRVERVIWKDPIAAMAARAAVARFDLPVVVTYRSPEAVVGSLKRLGWRFDVHALHAALGAPDLSGGPLPPRDSLGVVECGAVLWALVYDDLLRLHRERPDRVILIDMDAVIRDPAQVYDALFERLGLAKTPSSVRAIDAAVARSRDTGKADRPSGHPHSRNRNVGAANRYWRDVLTDEEVETVRARTHAAAALFGPNAPVS